MIIVFENTMDGRMIKKILIIYFITLIPYKLNYIINTNMAKI